MLFQPDVVSLALLRIASWISSADLGRGWPLICVRFGAEIRAVKSLALTCGKGSVGSMGRTMVVLWNLNRRVQSVHVGMGVLKVLCRGGFVSLEVYTR